MKVAIIGANGQLGTDLHSAFMKRGDEVAALTHADIEVANAASVALVLRSVRPDAVVNTSALHDVEGCDREPERAFAVNAVGPDNLASICRELGIVFVHLSTDYVFDGKKRSPYVESDPPSPLNVYGRTKLQGEELVCRQGGRYFLVRTSSLYGKAGCRAKKGLNFIGLMMKLARERDEVRVVDCETVTPTSTTELSRHILALTRSDAYGIYHATAEGSCSWYEFAREIFVLTSAKVRLAVADPSEFPAKVPRPVYSVLDNAALRKQGLDSFRPWREGLQDYLA